MKAEALYSVEDLKALVWEWSRIRELRLARGDARQAAAAEERRAHFAQLLEWRLADEKGVAS
jgi:hypothetical protein